MNKENPKGDDKLLFMGSKKHPKHDVLKYLKK